MKEENKEQGRDGTVYRLSFIGVKPDYRS